MLRSDGRYRVERRQGALRRHHREGFGEHQRERGAILSKRQAGALFLQLLHGSFDLRFYTGNGTIKQHGRWHGVRPHRIEWVYGDHVPENAVTCAAFWLGLRCTGIFRKLLRHPVLWVPDVFRAWVGDSPQNRTSWFRIPAENRFPNCKDAHLSVGIPLQNTLYCGGPPQTSCSSWREQRNDAHPPRSCIELIL